MGDAGARRERLSPERLVFFMDIPVGRHRLLEPQSLRTWGVLPAVPGEDPSDRSLLNFSFVIFVHGKDGRLRCRQLDSKPPQLDEIRSLYSPSAEGSRGARRNGLSSVVPKTGMNGLAAGLAWRMTMAR
jgi:hypothetical protein